jgi:hypothetical protein
MRIVPGREKSWRQESGDDAKKILLPRGARLELATLERACWGTMVGRRDSNALPPG